MLVRFLITLTFLALLTGCCSYPFIYPNYCQKDYWGDSRFDIFGRKNCVGRTGTWVDQNNGRDGFFCTSPRCVTYEKVTCTDTCGGY